MNLETVLKVRWFSGQSLKNQRVAAGFTQRDFAQRSGIPIGTVRMYEQNRINPSTYRLSTIIAILGCSMDDLFTEV